MAQGLNAAGAAAGHIFAEAWRWAEVQGARPESMIGLAGTGDLVATALAPQSRNRRAGELLAPVTRALGRLIEGELPLDECAVVRATVPPPARWRPTVRAGFWRRVRERIRSWFGGRRTQAHKTFTSDEGRDATLRHETRTKERDDASDHREGGPAE